jgi:hypothetical protein
MGVGLAFISYAGQIQLALFVDKDLVEYPERLMSLTYEAFAKLELATRMGSEESPAATTELAAGSAIAQPS